MIDLVNRLRDEGLSRHDALLEGCRHRLRPILMTSLTAILGLLPMAIGAGEGAEVRAPMAVTVIGGLAVSTLLYVAAPVSVWSTFANLLAMPIVSIWVIRRTKYRRASIWASSA